MRCATCGEEIAEDNRAWRITIDGPEARLEGAALWDVEKLRQFARDMEPYGLVIASPLEHAHG